VRDHAADGKPLDLCEPLKCGSDESDALMEIGLAVERRAGWLSVEVGHASSPGNCYDSCRVEVDDADGHIGIGVSDSAGGVEFRDMFLAYS